MRIEDFTVFGRTVPERSKKYGPTVCMAGYSEEMDQLLRIYPLGIISKAKARHTLKVDVEKNNRDTREESWALKGRTEDSIISTGLKIHAKKLRRVLQEKVSSSIDELNKEKKSLGIIKAKSFDDFEVITKSRPELEEQKRGEFDDFANQIRTGKDYAKIPYLKINDNGKKRCIQIREWGVFELIRRCEKVGSFPSAEYIKKALYLQPNKEIFFVVGNMYKFRNSWLVIKSFTFSTKAHNKFGSKAGLY